MPPENYMSEGSKIYLEGATAASNIVAGTMVAVNTASNQIYSYELTTAGLSGTAGGMGIRFIGVLEDNVSAGQVGVTVATEGIFRFRLSTAMSANYSAWIGRPVFVATGGLGQEVIAGADAAVGVLTGALAIGTVVDASGAGLCKNTGDWVAVKINPGAFRWGPWSCTTATLRGDTCPA
jgi:hypothetical protein